jgi:hypothetical protein
MWEADDKVSYAQVGETLGISKQAVAKKAKEQKWQRRMDLARVVNKAHQVADRATVHRDLPAASFAANTGKSASEVVDGLDKKAESGVEHMQAEEVDDADMTPEQRAERLAVAKRAEILTRHRTELNAARQRIYESIKAKDPLDAFARGKVAKITTEAISILHAAERKAWGLDKPDEAPPVIVVERG